MKNVSAKSCSEIRNTHLFSTTFHRKSCSLWDNVETYCRKEQVTDDNMAHAHCMPDNEGYTHTHTDSQYTIIISLPLQQWLHKRTSVLRYTYICLSCYNSEFLPYSYSQHTHVSTFASQIPFQREDIVCIVIIIAIGPDNLVAILSPLRYRWPQKQENSSPPKCPAQLGDQPSLLFSGQLDHLPGKVQRPCHEAEDWSPSRNPSNYTSVSPHYSMPGYLAKYLQVPSS